MQTHSENKMPDVDTEQLDDLKAEAKKMPEPMRTILIVILAVIPLAVGGGVGQSVFGVSQDKIDAQFEKQQVNLDRAIEASKADINGNIEILKVQSQNRDSMITANANALAEMSKLVRDLERRVTRMEARNGTD